MRGKPASDLNASEVRDMALRYLARREYGIEELRRKLTHRGVESGLAEQIVGDLVDADLLSDQRFTEMYVRTRMRQLYGPLKIRAELRARGVSDHQVAAEMPADQQAWFDAASQWASKRSTGELDYAGKARLHRSLMNRGFTYEQASVAVDNLNSID
jgi:regulatory protein